MKVKCINVSKDVSNFGRGGTASGVLEVGKEYTVIDTEVHSWHTTYELEEIPDKIFNSCHFEEIVP